MPAGVILIQSSMPSAILCYLVASMYSPKEIVDNIFEHDCCIYNYVINNNSYYVILRFKIL